MNLVVEPQLPSPETPGVSRPILRRSEEPHASRLPLRAQRRGAVPSAIPYIPSQRSITPMSSAGSPPRSWRSSSQPFPKFPELVSESHAAARAKFGSRRAVARKGPAASDSGLPALRPERSRRHGPPMALRHGVDLGFLLLGGVALRASLRDVPPGELG